jgi:hypothetical protein
MTNHLNPRQRRELRDAHASGDVRAINALSRRLARHPRTTR